MSKANNVGEVNISITIAAANSMAGSLLSDHFKRHSEFSVLSCVTDRVSLLQSVQETKPNVALVSADLQDGLLSGLAAVRELHDADTDIYPILLIDRPEPHIVVEGLRSGARGVFCQSNFNLAVLRKCVRRVCEGQIWLGNTELEHVLAALSQSRPLRVVSAGGLKLLSPREEEVMRLVSDGLGNREIASLMNLSEHTVKNYLFHIFDKLGISNRVELVLYAISNPKKDITVYSAEDKKLLAKSVGGDA
jgi:DNA-binding NarL/FixJ family response regulator